MRWSGAWSKATPSRSFPGTTMAKCLVVSLSALSLQTIKQLLCAWLAYIRNPNKLVCAAQSSKRFVTTKNMTKPLKRTLHLYESVLTRSSLQRLFFRFNHNRGRSRDSLSNYAFTQNEPHRHLYKDTHTHIHSLTHFKQKLFNFYFLKARHASVFSVKRPSISSQPAI